MSPDTAAAGNGTDRTSPELPAALDAVRRNALQFLADLPRQPSALRIRAGELTLEAEWSTAEPAVAAARPTPVESVAATTAAGAVADSGQHFVRAPTVGVFYQAPEPGAKPFVTEGDIVSPGEQVGIVEAMKLMIPVNADVHGTVVALLCEDGAGVEYDERLIALAPLDAG
ncbi:acetyl-CoA carboxylase biotin carboxyl carrier protein subunit [Micromonospora sp. LAH09]|uniref:acetyl-CoA carboxylase biotin carboxyl carrier protein n=1 Tax=Micromonospora cabrerizensis TaxID=2911213 RepID=UPI001EE789C5|nr:biotin/lipoyl-containing protein [Micromonospora cabrerizensis]MCG5468339.1 acetyl-CoA carboxylase biotin carboxyl carrier protein subunit [Micromonospora cabrerizensis]